MQPFLKFGSLVFSALFISLLLCPERASLAVYPNPNCVVNASQPNELDCDLLPESATGNQPSEIGVSPGQYAVLTNNTGTYLQINQVVGITNEQLYWSEFCVFLNDYQTSQPTPGNGEVGCMTKNPGEDYPPLQWDGVSSALSVPPGSSIYISSHTVPSAENHDYVISTYAQSTGINAYRAPQADAPIVCNGAPQSTAWAPWVNNTSGPLHLMGATIYSVSANSSSPNQITEACIYTLNTDGSVKTSHCADGENQRRTVSFPTELVQPGEAIAAQGVNTCTSGADWDWAAYMYVW